MYIDKGSLQSSTGVSHVSPLAAHRGRTYLSGGARPDRLQPWLLLSAAQLPLSQPLLPSPAATNTRKPTTSGSNGRPSAADAKSSGSVRAKAALETEANGGAASAALPAEAAIAEAAFGVLYATPSKLAASQQTPSSPPLPPTQT